MPFQVREPASAVALVAVCIVGVVVVSAVGNRVEADKRSALAPSFASSGGGVAVPPKAR